MILSFVDFLGSVVLSMLVLVGAGAISLLALLRLFMNFRSMRRFSDGGQQALRPILRRIAGAVGTKSVSIVVDLAEVGDDSGSSSVAMIKTLLAQKYGSLEVVAIAAEDRVPTDLHLAFDLQEIGSQGSAIMYRSARDNRLICVVAPGSRAGSEAESNPLNAAIGIASGDLLLPFDAAWQLRPSAVADLAAPWVQQPQLAATFGILHPVDDAAVPSGLVAARAEMLAVAGIGSGPAPLASIGYLASGQHRRIIGLVNRAHFRAIGGLSGPVADPETWMRLGISLEELQRDRVASADVQVLSRHLGEVDGSLTSWPTTPLRSDLPGGLGRRVAPLLHRVAGNSGTIAIVALAAGVLGGVLGQVSADVLWIGASAPLLLATVLVIGLMMDDRAFREVGSTRSRLLLLVGAGAAATGGVGGSPLRFSGHGLSGLRRSAGKFH